MFPFEGVAYAMAPGGGSGDGGPMSTVIQFVPLVLIFVIFWFLVIRPQQKKAKDHKAMLSQLKTGDAVITDSGIFATIRAVGDEFIKVEIGDKEKLVIKLLPGRIANVVKKSKDKDSDAGSSSESK